MKRTQGKKPKILVDGSNVIYCGKRKPRLKNLQLMIEKLMGMGYDYSVFVDPKTRWKLPEEEREEFERMISEELVQQTPPTMGADSWFLEYATNHPEYRVLSNDRFVDWRNKFPWVNNQNLFIRFMIINDEVYLREREDVVPPPEIQHRVREEAAPRLPSKPPLGTKKPRRAMVLLPAPKRIPSVAHPKIPTKTPESQEEEHAVPAGAPSCPKCLFEIPKDSKFCPFCGAKLHGGQDV